MDKKIELMPHPFSGDTCQVTHLNVGDEVMPHDLYRSMTVANDGSQMNEQGGLGKWVYAGNMLAGSIIGPECNVHFIRLVPTE
jgi:hypothetical protein